ncbi:MAG TPA: hypothetical protein VMF90_03125 [Rhizobiaceae bacterium]|nr:hypothetical protein [Rhizobiaceae bacterium]
MPSFGPVSGYAVSEGATETGTSIFLPVIVFEQEVSAPTMLLDVAFRVPLVEFTLSAPAPRPAPDNRLRLPVVTFTTEATPPAPLLDRFITLPGLEFQTDLRSAQPLTDPLVTLPVVTFEQTLPVIEIAGVTIRLPVIITEVPPLSVKLSEDATVDFDFEENFETDAGVSEAAVSEIGPRTISRPVALKTVTVIKPIRALIDVAIVLPVIEMQADIPAAETVQTGRRQIAAVLS